MNEYRPFHLTVAHVRAKGREAFLAGKLSAQAECFHQRRCAYSVPVSLEENCNCIIGAALPPETLQRIRDLFVNSSPVEALIGAGGVIEVTSGELGTLCAAQGLHDDWARMEYSIGAIEAGGDPSRLDSLPEMRAASAKNKAELMKWLEIPEVVS